MKKSTKILATVVAVATMLVGVVACSKSSKADAAGDYVSKLDLSDYFGSQLGTSVDDGTVVLELDLTLKKDGSYKMTADSDEFIDSVTDLMHDVMIEQGMTDDEIDEYVEYVGYDSLKAFVEDSFSDMTEFTVTGPYEIDGDTITLEDEEGEVEAKYETGKITMDASDLGFDGIVDDDIVFEK